jgi:methionyl-tRNA synthetase
VSEEAYLFRLSQYKESLIHYITGDEFEIRPLSRKMEVLSFLQKEELRDVAISRQNVAWGIQVPWDASHTVYVWVDALLNYLSATRPDGPDFSGVRPDFPPTLQLIGKDILRFHGVIWPAMLIAAYKEKIVVGDRFLPHKLFVHGYFTIDGHKMSKSLGNIITPSELLDRYGVDGARYVLLASTQFGADGDVSWEQFDSIYSNHLANNIGNVVSRVQAMAVRYLEGKVDISAIDHAFVTAYQEAVEGTDLSRALQLIQTQLDAINQDIEQHKPWELARANSEKLPTLIGGWLADIYAVGACLVPFMPQTAMKILAVFGTSIDQINYATLDKEIVGEARTIQPTEPLFPRLV